MKKNQGFVVTGILYSLLILFSIIIFGMLLVAASRQSLFYKLGNDMVAEMGSSKKEYRYFKEDLTYSDWKTYRDVSDIYHTYPLTAMPNMGESNHLMYLTGTNLEMLISNGHAGVRFNGSTSYAKNQVDILSAAYPTIYLDFSASVCDRTIASLDHLDKSIALDADCKIVVSSNGSASSTTSSYVYPKGTRVQLILLFQDGKYDTFVQGQKYAGTTTTNHAEALTMQHLALGYHEKDENKFFQGILYALAFDQTAITEAQALTLNTTFDHEAYLNNATISYNYRNYLHTR